LAPMPYDLALEETVLLMMEWVKKKSCCSE